MQSQHLIREHDLLAAILAKNPGFGSKGYLDRRDALARIHAPNAPGPGPQQRPTVPRDTIRA